MFVDKSRIKDILGIKGKSIKEAKDKEAHRDKIRVYMHAAFRPLDVLERRLEGAKKDIAILEAAIAVRKQHDNEREAAEIAHSNTD